MKASLLFGLSGLRSAALPLPLGVFRPSERYWWPLSPSSSLRFACSQKETAVTGPVCTSLLLLHHTLRLDTPHSRGLTQKANPSHKFLSPVVIQYRPSDGWTKWLLSSGFIIHPLFQCMCWVQGWLLRTSHTLWDIKFTFVEISRSDLVGYSSLCSLDAVFAYTQTLNGYFSASHFL